MEVLTSLSKRVAVLPVLLALAWPTAAAAGGDLRLVEAVRHRDVAAFGVLLRENIDVDVAQPDGATALHWAAHWDDQSAARELIRAGANVTVANDYGVTPLSLAATNGSATMLEILLQAGADVNTTLPLGETALMTAARGGNVAAVEVLLSRGARVEAKESTQGQNALMWAVSEHHLDVVRSLLAHGASAHDASNGGFTPLLFAAREGAVDIARLLLASGADLDRPAEDGTTPLLVAVVRAHVPLAKMLLDLGADPNLDAAGYTALHWAAGTWESEFTKYYDLDEGPWRAVGGLAPSEQLEFVKVLLAHGANPNARVVGRVPRLGGCLGGLNLAGATPFIIASMSANTAAMRLLAANGADPRLTTTKNATALLAAAGLNRNLACSELTEAEVIDAIRLAIAMGNDVNAPDDAGETPLHATAYLGTNEVAGFLLERGAHLNARNGNDQTPLGVAEAFYFSFMILSNKKTAVFLREQGATDLGAPPVQPPAP